MLLSPLFMLAFVFSRLDYCSSIFAGLLGVRMEKLRRVHCAAAQLIGGFMKFDHISLYMRAVFHWPPFPQRISYRIASLVWRCLSGWAPSYLLCRPLSSCAGHRTLPPLFTVMWWSHSPALRQCRPVLFLWLVQQHGMDLR